MPSRRYREFEPSIVAALDAPPARSARLASLVIMVFLGIAGAWLYHAETDIVVSANGEIVPAGNVKRVQAAVAGVIRNIRVRDGEAVVRGDVLLALDDTASLADQDGLLARRARLALTTQRLRAELGDPVTVGENVDAPASLVEMERARLAANLRTFEERVARLRSDIDSAAATVEVSLREVETLELRIRQGEQHLRDKKVQVSKGLIPRQDAVSAQFELESLRKEIEIYRERTRAGRIALDATREALDAARSEHRSTLLAELATNGDELERLGQELIKAGDHVGNQVIRAPVDGVVQELKVNTVGGVVKHGDVLLTIVPADGGVELNVKILNKDVGFVRATQPVRVKVNAFEFTRYGTVDGELQWIGSDAVVDEQLGLVYPARVALSRTTLPNRVDGLTPRVTPGMQATADIVIGRRRLYEYFLAPLLRYRDESLRER